MSLRVNSERWCESGSEVVSSRGHLLRCGDVATSICDGCGVALCDSHEKFCPVCFGVTCPHCDHICQSRVESSLTKAA